MSLALCAGLAFLPDPAHAQAGPARNDSLVDNLVHTEGYRPAAIGAIPRSTKAGTGGPALILIPGIGFDGPVFADFMERNADAYTMYAITLPGFGGTSAPAMPPAGTSYGERTWIGSAVQGIVALIEQERLDHPVLVGHFVLGTQVAISLAATHPDKIGGLVLLGGVPKFIPMEKGQPKDYPLPDLVRMTDAYAAPIMFKHIGRSEWNDGNYLPEVYSLDTLTGRRLWEVSAENPLPVMIRYLCEYIASDASMELAKVRCPVLVLRPSFNSAVLKNITNDYVAPQFRDGWDRVVAERPSILVKDIPDAASFVWKDAPGEVDKHVGAFVGTLQR